jgi:hypothetical protein
MEKVFILARDYGNAYLVVCDLATAKKICAVGGADRVLGSVKITKTLTQKSLQAALRRIYTRHRVLGYVSASSTYHELVSTLPDNTLVEEWSAIAAQPLA